MTVLYCVIVKKFLSLNKNSVMDGKTKCEDLTDITAFYWEANRLETFTKWPFDEQCKCNAKKMAEAGFYASGNQDEIDLAKCFFCDKELDGWEPDDDPWCEHKKHSKKCVFLAYGRPGADLTVMEHLELIKNYNIWKAEKRYDSIKKTAQEEFKELVAKVKSSQT